jgi:hypothetical protein
MSYPTCSHRKADGILCGSPALRGQKLCYFHQRDHQRQQQIAHVRRRAETLLLHLPPLETLADVQVALFEVLDSLAANCIEPSRASALLFALQQVSGHLRQPQVA